MIDKILLCESVAPFGVSLTDEMCEKFDRYAELLVEWNEKMNLTAITDPVGIAVKHFADSLSALPLLPEKQGIKVIDVGTGAGFPGIPLAIARPDIRLTLLDSLNKRLLFLSEVCTQLGIPAQTVHARAEDGARDKTLREAFDVATARAVATLPVLAEYCLPYVKVKGQFIAMKGPESDAECEAALRAVSLLGGGVPERHALQLAAPDETLERRLFVIPKVKSTPIAYPRPTAKIKKGAL